MSVFLGLLVGFGSLRLLLLTAPDLYRSPALARTNYRGKAVATGGGLFVVLAVVLVEGTRIGLGALGLGHQPGFDGTRPLVLLACVGFGLLGLLDDLLATGADRGFRGHLHALAQGRVTTGFVKLVAGVALALVIASAPGPEPRVHLIVDAVLIAAAANLANLFDRAPGRALKVGVVAWIPLAILAGGDALGIAIAPVIGAFVAILPDDLGERIMLGDAGANVLGAVVGLAAVLETSPTTRAVIAILLLGLNAASEWVSFGRVIDRVPYLRWVDRLGSRAHP
jgi:UDP-N-acetylmuramyl pentapeptide phosphotransferase/UDP-N-acetylglucosamine-1-phosphate transferase